MKKLLSVLIILYIGVAFVQAQTVPVVNTAPDAGSFAMGNNGILSAQSAFHVYGNISRMALSDNNVAIGISWMPWMPQLINKSGLQSIAGSFRIANKHGVGFGYRYFYLPSFPITNNNGIIIKETKPRDFTIDLGYCYTVTPRLVLGLNVHFISSLIAESKNMSKANAIAVDIDLLFHNNGWTLGFCLKNWGTQLRYSNNNSDLPSAFQFTATKLTPLSYNHTLQANMAIQYRVQPQGFNGIEGGGGVEYAYRNMLFLRGGYHFGQEEKTSPCYMTVGAGVLIKMVKLDAAYIIAKNNNPMDRSYCLTMNLLW